MELLIFPANGNGLEALDCLPAGQRLAGFIDDTKDKFFTFPVFSREIFDPLKHKILAIPGSPQSFKTRKKIISSLGLNPHHFFSAIHPSATVSDNSKHGYNLLIMAGARICGNASIGNHVIIRPNTVISHDAVIEDYAIIGSNVSVSGYVTVGSGAYIGPGVTIIDHVRIGPGALVGAGSVVTKDVGPGSVVAGNPAKKLNH